MRIPFAALVGGFAAVALGLSSLAEADDDDSFRAHLETFKNSVAIVEAYKGPGRVSSGTGFLCRDRNVLITNNHVIEGANSVFARFPASAGTVECRLLDQQASLDLAALSLTRDGAATPLLRLPDNAELRPRQLDRVLVIGNPKKLNWTVHTGSISAVRSSDEVPGALPAGQPIEIFQVDLSGAPGMSGAPVIDRQGQLLGVFFAGIDQGRYGLNFCIPHRYVRQLRIAGAPRRFSGAGGPDLSGNFSGTGVTHLSDRNLQQVPGVEAPVPPTSNHWGFVEADPDLILQNFVEDKEKFSRFIPRGHLAQLVQRKRLLQVTNGVMGYRVLVPQGFTIDDSMLPNGIFQSLIHYPNLNFGIRILVRPVGIPIRSRQDLDREMDASVGSFVRNVLGRNLRRGFSDFPDPSEVIKGPSSDPDIRFSNVNGAARLWDRYLSQPQYNATNLVLYGISRDLFYTVDYTFPSSMPDDPVLPDRFVEESVIFCSFSFLN
jgi:hypothetical protein